MSKPNFSLLTGSGFSIPEGLPGVSNLNDRLSKIDESEIYIHTDMRAMFLNGQPDPNARLGRIDRLLIQEFLEFYNNQVLEDGKSFHYETFYDFYSKYISDGDNEEVIEEFYAKFNDKNLSGGKGGYDCYNRIIQFDRTYNQLLAQQLLADRYFEDISFGGHSYGAFIRFLKKTLETHDIKFHTLNHDLFFDHLGRHHVDLWQNFCDGFQLEGSPFYGYVGNDFGVNGRRVHKQYLVKLPHFMNRFDKPLAYFKLHGSIITKVVHIQGEQPSRVRIKSDYAVGNYHIETYDPATGKGGFTWLFDDVMPDFISGTANKLKRYISDPYYTNLMAHFEKNLEASDQLLVLGYGFQDPGINDHIERFFLTKGKRMVVIDPRRPESDLLDRYEFEHVAKGVIDVTYEEYLELLGM